MDGRTDTQNFGGYNIIPRHFLVAGHKKSKLSHLMRLWYFSSSVTHSSNVHAQPSSVARYLIFGRTLRLLPYFMCANSEGSGETVQMHRLA